MKNARGFSPAAENFLNEYELSHWIGVPRSTLQRWRLKGEGPPFHEMAPRTVRYRLTDVQSWLAATQKG